MIRTLADLLKVLSIAEAARISALGIKHAPTIGAMYEGLSASLLSTSLPNGLDLKIVSGFATDGAGGTSGQIDCMLVQGEGALIPYTSSYQWHVKDIIAIVEVKKTLYAGNLADAYMQVADVLRVHSQWVQANSGPGSVNVKASRRVFSEITGEVAPRNDQWRQHPLDRHLILHAIIADQLAPIRIVLGYEGYQSEKGLRDGFSKYLESNIGVMGFGPTSMPNLIISGEFSLVKLSGHPFRAPLDSDGFWPIVASARVNPLLLLLEVIWTRLSYSHSMSHLFGDDLEVENLAALLAARPEEVSPNSGRWGWNLKGTTASEANLSARPAFLPWEPTELTAKQYQLVMELCENEEVDTSDSDFIAYYGSEPGGIEGFISSLLATRLVAMQGTTLSLTTTECTCVIMPDGRWLAGDNNSGRVVRWVARQTDAAKSAPTDGT